MLINIEFYLFYVVCHQRGRRNVTEITILQLDIFPAERLGVTDLYIFYGLECIFKKYFEV